MASFSKGTSFTDGVTGDVTAAKLHALVDAATPVPGFITDRTAETSIATDDLVLISDTSESGALNKMTVANFTNIVSTGTGTAADPAIRPTGDTNTGLFFPAADTIAFAKGGTEAMRIISGGRVGIGTTNPEAPLVVSYQGEQGIETGWSTGGQVGFLQCFNRNTTSYDTLHISGSAIVFNTGSATASERLRIDSSGNVGIGTSTSLVRLTVDSGSAAQYGRFNSTAANGGYLTFESSSTVHGDIGTAAQLVGGGSATDFGINARGSRNLILGTNNTERLRIDSSGNVGIGTSSPSAQLELATDSAKKPSTNTWTVASDERLKTNITPADLDRCYEIVKTVALKRYTWKPDVYSVDQVKDRSKLGWIAQDVEAVFPKAVGTNRFAYNQVFEEVVTPEVDAEGNPVLDENGVQKTKTEKRLVSEDVIEDCKDLNSDQIYAVMYGTIQKLIAKVETLEAKVAALEAA